MATTETYPTLTAAHAGCWFDGARGVYLGEAVIALARAAGWKADGYQEGDFSSESEWYHEAWDAAESFLDSLAPAGFWIGSTESGDFGMWAVEPDDC